jgi:hypothetical protein
LYCHSCFILTEVMRKINSCCLLIAFIFSSPVVNLRNKKFSIMNVYVLPTQYIYVFRMKLGRNWLVFITMTYYLIVSTRLAHFLLIVLGSVLTCERLNVFKFALISSRTNYIHTEFRTSFQLQLIDD